MTETLTGKQVLALLAQDEPPEIEFFSIDEWKSCKRGWEIRYLRETQTQFRIKQKPQRRLSVTLANGEEVSWPEPVREREALKYRQVYWRVFGHGTVDLLYWDDSEIDALYLAFGNAHLTREAAQEHADALRKINTQGVV